MKIKFKNKKWIKLTTALLFITCVFLFSYESFAGFRLKKSIPVVEEKIGKAKDIKISEEEQIKEKEEALILENERLQIENVTKIKIPPPYEDLKDEVVMQNEIVSGFGSDVPLIIAMQQIAPSKYQFSFSGDIDPSLTVSWRGNKAWKGVLADTLGKEGLMFTIDRNIIVIKETPIRKEEKALAKKIKFAPAKKGDIELPISLKRKQKVVRPMGYKAPNLTPLSTIPLWEATTEYTLREILTDWCEKEGINLYWSIDYDYRIEKYFAFEGNFATAVATLINRFKKARPQPYGQLHRGTRNPLVLVIGSYDLSH